MLRKMVAVFVVVVAFSLVLAFATVHFNLTHCRSILFLLVLYVVVAVLFILRHCARSFVHSFVRSIAIAIHVESACRKHLQFNFNKNTIYI